MRNNKIIIGVVGATRNLDQLQDGGREISNVAQEIGREITKHQHVILTGGLPSDKIPSPVKSSATFGAKMLGTRLNPARIISVLPKQSILNIKYKPEENSNIKHLIIETPYSDERNFINGCLPDVMIAVHGGAGTLSEIAFAHSLDVPIVLVQMKSIDTLHSLKQSIQIPANKFKFLQILENTHKEFPLFVIDQINSDIHEFLNNGLYKTAESAEEAVNMALNITINRPNKLPFDNGVNDKFEMALDDLTQ